MNSTKRYLPLSLLLVIVCSAGDARANSALDPYAHVKAPEPKKAATSAIPSADTIITPTSYVVNMSMEGTEGEKKGIVGSMMSGITAPSKSIKKASSGMVSGTKAAGANLVKGSKFIGDGMAKGATAIGAGIMTTGEKMVDGTQAVGSKIANVVPGRNQSPQKTASLNDIYIDKVKTELSQVDSDEAARQLAASTKDSKDNVSSSRKAFLSLDKKSKVKPSVAQSTPANGFLEGALASEAKTKHPELNYNGENAKAAEAIATKPLDAPKDKKKWSVGLHKPSIKIGLFKKKGPASEAKENPALAVADNTSDLSPQDNASTKPAQIASKEAPVKETPSAESILPTEKSSTLADAGPETSSVDAKKSKFGKLPLVGKGISMPKLKLNPFAKNKQAPEPGHQTASTEDQANKDLQL